MAAEWDALRVEHRQIGPGAQNCVRPECTELVYILSGQALVRRTGDGQKQEGMARPSTSWLVPAGTHETLLELDGSTECLIIFLPDKLLEDSALADYGIDPDRTQLAYAGGFADATLAQIGAALHGMLGRESQPMDRIFADGLRTALAAHLIGNYTVDRWQPSTRAPSLDAKRLQRVLDFMEAQLADDLSLDDLAREACLSPYHFSRLFHEATGRPPHRYLIERRIQVAHSRHRLWITSQFCACLSQGHRRHPEPVSRAESALIVQPHDSALRHRQDRNTRSRLRKIWTYARRTRPQWCRG